jgi:hypothetical protein
MLPLAPCAACGNFVKTADALCPFCGATMATWRARSPAARMSRAAWLALGSSAAALGCAVTLTACAGDDTDGATASAVTRDDGGSSSDAASAQTFACGDASCNIATEFCSDDTCQGGGASCTPIDGGFPAVCAATPTCACLAPYEANSGYQFGCGVSDAGGMTWFATCAGCYGSPPARLERLAGLASV